MDTRIQAAYKWGLTMSEKLSINRASKIIYYIHIENSFEKLSFFMEGFDLRERKICIVTDSNVENLYADEVKKSLSEIAGKVVVFTMPAGEEHKTLETVKNLYTFLIEEHFDRKDMLAALGGGVVGDLCGYAAATYLRGIDFIQIPTTLLSQTDSSIGGKTGVDFDSYKNMVGAFHMPRLVYMNMSVLKSLDDRQFASGMAEVLKHGLIRDAAFYEWLIDHFPEINERDPGTLEEMIYRSCQIKKAIVEKDPTEKGERALLNFGHTIGHAIEKYMNFQYSHGECVALGCVAAAYISHKRGMLPMEDYYEIRDMFVPFSLPISISGGDTSEILKLTKSDKKMDGKQVKFILLKKVGKAIIDTTVTDEEIISAVDELIFKEEG